MRLSSGNIVHKKESSLVLMSLEEAGGDIRTVLLDIFDQIIRRKKGARSTSISLIDVRQ